MYNIILGSLPLGLGVVSPELSELGHEEEEVEWAETGFFCLGLANLVLGILKGQKQRDKLTTSKGNVSKFWLTDLQSTGLTCLI